MVLGQKKMKLLRKSLFSKTGGKFQLEEHDFQGEKRKLIGWKQRRKNIGGESIFKF
jgi:hypothetical protein